MNVQDELDLLKRELYDFSRRNPLVHTRKETVWWEDQPNVKLQERIFSRAQFYAREYGLETTLRVSIFIQWTRDERTYYFSPLCYRPVSINRNKRVNISYEIVAEEEENWQINPILIAFFQDEFGYSFPENVTDLDTLITELTAFLENGDSGKVSVSEDLPAEDQWAIVRKQAVGNFNYKKSALGKDYDMIRNHPNHSVTQLLSMNADKMPENDQTEITPIAPLDPYQKEIVQETLSRQLTIQGPPGTGKSHTIVSIIANYLAMGKKVLFVSEKRAALEVVYERLAQMNLDPLAAFFNTEKDQKKAFFRALSEAHQSITNNERKTKSHRKEDIFSLVHFYENELKKHRPNLDTNWISLIQKLALGKQNSIEALKANGKVPDYLTWQQAQESVTTAAEKLTDAFAVEGLGNLPFLVFNSVVFKENDTIVKLEKRLLEMKETLHQLAEITDDWNTDSSLDDLMRLALTASILAMVDKVQIDLLNPASKSFKSFKTWAKKYELLKTRLQQAEQANKGWSKKPTLAEITELLDLLKKEEVQNKKPSVMRILRRNPAKLQTAFRDFHKGISVHTRIKLLEAVKLEWRLKGELNEVKVKLKHNLNITDPDQEIDLIRRIRTKLDNTSHEDYLKILEHPDSATLIQSLSKLHPDLGKMNGQRRFLFYNHSEKSIKEWKEELRQLEEKLPLFQHWLPEIKATLGQPTEIIDFIRNNPSTSITQLDQQVTYWHLMNETRFYPEFKSMDSWSLIAEMHQKEAQDRLTFEENQSLILSRFREEIEQKEQRLATSSLRMKAEEKEEKKKWKKQRKIFFHEANKQQRHLPIYRFFEETKDYLLSVKPLWMMNPLSVSEGLPCSPYLFDLVIIDESSQIPLEDAIPAIYRGKRTVVVGDQKQMPPSSFFNGKTEVETVLDRATIAFKSAVLRWHYRSSHPDLIAFSNDQFYRNELVCIPPVKDENPVEWKWVGGQFEDHKNTSEATAIADYLQEEDPSISTLIVAFSKEQEKCIRHALKKSNIQHEFLEIRNLENVQGTEADRVIISIGYAPNEKEEFRLNFGPINREKGANRLNVLCSRARKKMVVFASIQGSDLQYSSNQGVNVLRDFLDFAAQSAKSNAADSPRHPIHQKLASSFSKLKTPPVFYASLNGSGIHAFVQHESGKVLVIDPCLHADESDYGYEVWRILSLRFQEVKPILSLDLWFNSERVSQEVSRFFA